MEVFLWVTKETEEIAAKRNASTDAGINAAKNAADFSAKICLVNGAFGYGVPIEGRIYI